MNILLSWIGNTDLVCSEKNDEQNLGPIMQALKAGSYDAVILLNNYPGHRVPPFLKWLTQKSDLKPKVHHINLSSPTAHKEIYEASRKCIQQIQKDHPEATITFHTSPGTPAMALCWFLLAPVCGARLIESSLEKGVQPINFPFEIAAYFLPDKDITRLSVQDTPAHPAFGKIIHKSPIMADLVARAHHVAIRDITVLIEGESGTGKELFAKAIHHASIRSNKPFEVINCGAIPNELIESVLFGYKQGAFTGANKDTAGVFEAANTGTLFLDELGELPQKAQVALLRVLQEKCITRIGDTKPIPVDVRIIAATNRKLIDEVAKGNFRADLFYRLAVACLQIPPLRAREEDVSLLLDDAITVANNELMTSGKEKHKKFSDSARKIILNHPWRGNVRELYNTVMRTILWSSEDVIGEEQAKSALFQIEQQSENILEYPIGNGFEINNLLAEISAHYIERAAKESGGNKTKAANLLGFKNYQTYTNWQKKYTVPNK